jgi:signal transduction histidine kinase/DNA-binding response OmpR family regulator/HPt (histidine-containing phosphotransfer) domain-containing protein
LRSIFEKKWAINSIYAQMFIIVIAFLIMSVSSFIFVSRIEHNHMIKDAENSLAFAEAEIIADLQEPETFLGGYSETIRSMLIRGESENILSAYITTVTNYFISDREQMSGLISTHGYFYTWGGKYLSGRNFIPPENFSPEDQSWYQRAFDAKGKTTISEPYKDFITGNSILTFSRYLADDNGNPLAIICLDIDLNRICKHAITINLTESSYGILINNYMEIMAHPEQYFIGEKLYNADSGIAFLSNELEAGLNIAERRVKNYMHDNSIVYFNKIKYDWFLGIVIPVNEYYSSVRNMAIFIIILGIFLASVLCTMIYYITQAKKKSDMRTQQKSNFLATMSHEIRTPLNAILGMTEIQMQDASHPPSTSEAFIKINNSGNLLLNIINDILDLSKIEAGKLELIPVKYEVARLINDIIQLNYIRYISKPIVFNLEIDENLPASLLGDELRIKQILNNLLSNAFKYTDKGEVVLSVNAECARLGGGAVAVTLVFQIRDTGQGMTSDQISKLFDEYTRFNLEANRSTEGAGLGMTITQNLINLMNGKIIVKSVINEGTSITVRLPQKTDGIGISGFISKEAVENLKQFKHSSFVQSKKTKITREYMPYGHVLIVDDVETNLYVAKGLMIPYGIKIDLATSGFEAIDKIKEGNIYDIIFMDHMMPKMDGIEATKQLRKLGYSKPIVALTANALAGHAEMFLNNSFDDFISKPIDIRQLNITLNKLIRDKQPLEVIEAAQKEKAELEKTEDPSSEFQKTDSQLAKIFARDAERASGAIKNCLQNDLNEEKNIQMYIINVHAMKSALSNIGEKDLSSSAFRLEQAGREKDVNVLLSETDEFLKKLDNIINEIKNREKANELSEDSEEALILLKEKLVIIKNACAEMEKKVIKNILIELREKPWSQKTGELLNSIDEHLLHSDFDEASALIDEFSK